MYCASKAYLLSFGKILNFELKDQADVFTFCPGWVQTNLVKGMKVTDAIDTVEASRVTWRDLGRDVYSHGVFKHEILGWSSSFGHEYIAKKTEKYLDK